MHNFTVHFQDAESCGFVFDRKYRKIVRNFLETWFIENKLV